MFVFLVTPACDQPYLVVPTKLLNTTTRRWGISSDFSTPTLSVLPHTSEESCLAHYRDYFSSVPLVRIDVPMSRELVNALETYKPIIVTTVRKKYGGVHYE